MPLSLTQNKNYSLLSDLKIQKLSTRALMPRINQLQMQIPTVFSPNFTIKGWVHAKHLAQHYWKERQLPSANLLLVIDKYLDPQLFLMETIWPAPEKG